jgi:dipeptidyl aminopeptidase/acylaminoacyl peptidase
MIFETMKRTSILFTGALLLPSAAQSQSRFDLTIPNIMRGPEVYGREPSNPRFTPNGEYIYFNWLPPGTDWRETTKPFRVRAQAGARPERVTETHMDSVGPSLAAGMISRDGARRVATYNGDLWLTDLRAGTTRRLTDTPAIIESNPTFAANGNRIYFLRDGQNVMSLDLDTPLIRQVTDIRPGPAPADPRRADGQRGVLEAQQKELFGVIRDQVRLDSINRVERLARESWRTKTLYLRDNERVTGLTVSPTGNALIVTTTITIPGSRQTIVPNWVTLNGYTEDLTVRTKVGDVQNGGRAAFMSLPSGEVHWLKSIPRDSTEAPSITAVLGWNDAGTQALLFAERRDFKERYLHRVDAAGGRVTTVDVLKDSAWVGGPCYPCGGFLSGSDKVWLVSEADGYAHLYTMNPDGSGKQQLTKGKWEVEDVRISADRRYFELHTSEVSPYERHFYRMPVAGGPIERITTAVGGHTVVVSPNGQLIADVYSQANRPPELHVAPYQPNTTLAQLTTSPTPEWLSHPWIKPEIVRIPASDVVQVPARIYRPRDVGARPNGAAVIFVHGAGYLHNVHNFWSSYSREYMFHHFLASKGYVVLDIDYRGSAGYGRDWRTAIYRWMGGRDLADHVDGSRYLRKEYGIPAERVGIYGGSYGGFITLMALFTAPKEFGAGAALRSVTDWAHYNHGYTGRILNLPQDDTLSFRRSSPIFFAEGLEDPLVMLHGMVDTNVHYQDIVRLTQRLIELGKTNWELASYPVENHGFVRPDSWTDEYRRIFDIFERSLKPGGKR